MKNTTTKAFSLELDIVAMLQTVSNSTGISQSRIVNDALKAAFAKKKQKEEK